LPGLGRRAEVPKVMVPALLKVESIWGPMELCRGQWGAVF
jgi:hypothetical protein